MTYLKRFALGIGLLVAVLAASAGALLWRAQKAPLSIEFARGLLEYEVRDAAPNAIFQYEDAEIQWHRLQGSLEIALKDVSLSGVGLPHPVFIQDVKILLDADKLLLGDLRLIRLTLQDYRTVIPLDELSTGRNDDDPMDYVALRHRFWAVSQAFMARKELAEFERLEILNGKIDLISPDVGAHHDIRLEEVIVNSAEKQAVFKAGIANLKGSAFLAGEADWGASHAQLVFSAPRLDQILYPYDLNGWGNALQMDVNAEIEAQFSKTLSEDQLQISLKLGQGDFVHLAHFPGPRAMKHGDFRFKILPVKSDIFIEQAAVDFADAHLAVNGAITGGFDKPAIILNGSLNGLVVSSLKEYWPPALGTGGNEWVQANIEDGRLPNGRLKVQITPDMWGAPFPADILAFSFDMEDLTAHYTRPMPPLTGAFGRGVLSYDDVVLFIDEGVIAGVDVGPSQVVIGRFSNHPQTAVVDLGLSGPVAELLQILDSAPLGFISDYGVTPSAAVGDARAEVQIRIPLVRDLQIENVGIKGHVETYGLGLTDIFGPEGLRDGQVAFDVTENGLLAKGNIALFGFSSDIEWTEDFRSASEDPTKAILTTRLTSQDLQHLGVDIQSRFEGELGVFATVRGRGAEIRQGQFTVDLKNAVLREPLSGWSKAWGEDARLFSPFSYQNDVLLLDNATLQGSGMDARFSLELNGANVVKATAHKIIFGRNDFEFNAERANERWNVQIGGRALDMAPFLTALYAPDTKGKNGAATPWPDFQAKIALDRLELANDTALIGLEGGMSVFDDHISLLNLAGNLQGAAPFELHMLETEPNVRQLGISASDAGLSAKALDLFTNAAGGGLTVSAEIRGRQDLIEIDGLATMTDFRLTQAPTLARILSMVSLSGIADLARDGRIEFREMRVPFTLRQGVFDIDDASANGPALGLTLNGQFVQSLAEADLRGVIVPAYGLNSLVGKLPLLGDLITGGDNEGLFAINYRISGDLTNPELSVNPASILAPGILRKIFSVGKGQVTIPELRLEPEPELQTEPGQQEEPAPSRGAENPQ